MYISPFTELLLNGLFIFVIICIVVWSGIVLYHHLNETLGITGRKLLGWFGWSRVVLFLIALASLVLGAIAC